MPQLAGEEPPGEVGLTGFFSFDLRLGWNIHPVRKWEQLQFSPQINIYNLFNHQNYDSPSLPLSHPPHPLPPLTAPLRNLRSRRLSLQSRHPRPPAHR